MSKKVLNDPAQTVSEAIEGVVLTQPSDKIRRLGSLHVLYRPRTLEEKSQEVALISGGGSGHEPAHWGYIGQGMLTAAVAGNVFASPSVSSILATIRFVTGSKGCLLIVKNYTGDKLNFGMALEKANSEGLQVKMVIVAGKLAKEYTETYSLPVILQTCNRNVLIDDCALPIGKGITGGRGVAGTVFVHKIAGAV
jgi:triose/dihydroxyacetone kinase / FAD-AMP lyase (cyclizing)